MKPNACTRSVLLALASSLLAVSSASSAELYWSGNGTSQGGAGTWGTSNANWGTVAAGPYGTIWNNSNNDTAIFASTAGTVTLGNNVTVGGLTFNTTGYSIAPGTGPFGINFGVPGEINVSTGTTTISAVISGSAIEKTGGGTLRLDGVNTFDGLVLSGGRVDIGAGSDALGAAGSLITVKSNSTLGNSINTAFSLDKRLHVESGATLTFIHGGSSWTVQGVVSGSGTIKVNDAGNINQRPLSFSNTANTFTGAIDLLSNNATVTVGSLSDAVGSGNIWMGNSAFQLGATADAPMVLTNRAFDLRSGTGRINNNNTANGSANTLTINSDLIVTTTGNKTFQLGGTNTRANTFAGSIGDSTHESGGVVSFTKADAGTWRLSNAGNSYTGVTTISGGILEVSKLANGGANSSIGTSSNAASNLLLANVTILRYTGSGDSSDRSFTINGTAVGHSATLDASGTGAINLTNTASPAFGTTSQTRTLTLTGTNTENNTLAANIGNNGGTDSTGAVSVVKSGIGTWVLSGSNANTGSTTLTGGGKLILDYTNNTSKLADTNGALVLGGANGLGGGTLTLKGGSHTEVVTSTSLNMGGTFITRDSGTSKLNLNVITRVAGGSISFTDATIATTDTNNTNGILGGWATIGSHWAKSVDSGASDTAITAFTDYTTFVTATGSSTVNYQLTGSANLSATVAANSLRIVSDGDNQILNLGNNRNLNITNGTVGGLGGIIYAGGGNGNYTIEGTGTSRVGGTTTAENVINVYAGTLTINAMFAGGTNGGGGSSFTKFGEGTLVLGGANGFTGGNAAINEGTVRLTNNLALGTVAGGTVVQNGAALELASSVAIGAEALRITGTGIANAGALRNIAGNTSSYAGAITLGAGGARINSDASGALTLTGGVVTSLFNDVTFGGAGDTTVSTTAISGAGNVIKDGAGTLTLSAANTYTGATNVTAGTLAVTGTGSINSSSGVTIASGAVFRYNSSTALTTAITNNGGTLTGSGTLNVALALNSTNDVLAPGNSPGTMTLGVSQTWNSFTYEWETNNFTGTEAGTNYDLIAITGTLNLTANTAGSYILDLVSLMGDNASGNVPNFSEINRSWAIVTTTAGISGFDESFWTINSSGFTSDPVWTGTWSLGLGNDDKDLLLTYTVIPEPKAAILGALGILLLLRRRR